MNGIPERRRVEAAAPITHTDVSLGQIRPLSVVLHNLNHRMSFDETTTYEDDHDQASRPACRPSPGDWRDGTNHHAEAPEAAMTMPMSVTAERTQWATRIWAVWQKSVDNIIETGRLLHAAKADPKMQHGEWGTMVESDLPFNRHTAHKLMQIAGDKRLTNVSPGKHLPPSWTTLYELTRLDDDTLERKLRDGTIHPGMRRKMSEFRRGLDEYADEATSG
jgi:hypothetical protein